MNSLRDSSRTWYGKNRRHQARRAEDLKRCHFCNIHYSWKSSSSICSVCAEKITLLYKHKGTLVNIQAWGLLHFCWDSSIQTRAVSLPRHSPLPGHAKTTPPRSLSRFHNPSIIPLSFILCKTFTLTLASTLYTMPLQAFDDYVKVNGQTAQ